MTHTEKLLRELIALPSVNPAFLPGHHPHAGERRIAEFLAAIGAKAGLDVELSYVKPSRPNVFVRLAPTERVRHRVLFAPHLDTVNAATPDQFTPVRRQGRIYGRGACDTKGPAASMLTALCGVARSGQRPRHTEVMFAGLVDEEYGQAGSRSVAAYGPKADLAVVGEPTRLRLVTAHKGNVWLRLSTRGRAAHGATPHLGRNAVHRMAKIVDVLETQYAANLRRRTHPLLGSPTVTVGVIRGGTQPNIVPDACEIQLDRRTLPGESEASVRREVHTLLRKRGLSARISGEKAGRCPALETDPDHPLARTFLRVLRQPRPAGVHFFCDAAVLASGGIPSIVFGPGDIAQAHTSNEWISTTSLERGTQVLMRFLRLLP